MTTRQAAPPLAVHRNTVARWLRTSRAGGLPALLTDKEAGAPSGQKSRPAAVGAQRQARLASPRRLARAGDIHPWLRESCALPLPQQTLYRIVNDQRKATLKRPRPSHAKKKRRRERTLSSRVPAAWGPSPPEAVRRLSS